MTKGKDTHAFIFEYTPAATAHHHHLALKMVGGGGGNNKKQRSTNIPACRQTDTRHKAERRHTRTHLPDTQRKLTDKHTKRWAQSTAQPEVYFMQEYSKVCFTIQLNIKGGYIPLWSLTPQWTNPRHPHPLTAYTESCWTSPLITRQKTEEDFASLCKNQDIFKCMHSLCHEPFKDCVIFLKFEG